MRIYLVRHGKAADEGYAVDAHRPLTDEGRARMRRTAKAWAKNEEKEPELWFVSPLVRAVQTAEICIDAFKHEGPCEVTASLVPDAPISKAAALFDRDDVEAIAAVGHEPLMSALASHLIGARFPVDFRKGAVLALDRKEASKAARIAWFLEPAKDDRDARFREDLE